MQVSGGPDEHFLCYVLGFIWIAQRQVRQPEDSLPMFGNDRFPCAFVATPRPPDQVGFTPWHLS